MLEVGEPGDVGERPALLPSDLISATNSTSLIKICLFETLLHLNKLLLTFHK